MKGTFTTPDHVQCAKCAFNEGRGCPQPRWVTHSQGSPEAALALPHPHPCYPRVCHCMQSLFKSLAPQPHAASWHSEGCSNPTCKTAEHKCKSVASASESVQGQLIYNAQHPALSLSLSPLLTGMAAASQSLASLSEVKNPPQTDPPCLLPPFLLVPSGYVLLSSTSNFMLFAMQINPGRLSSPQFICLTITRYPLP